VRLYQVTCITLGFVLFEGGWYILILPVGTRFFDVLRFGFSTFVLGYFDVCRFCEDAEEASLKMPLRTTAAIEPGSRGLAEHVPRRPFGSCMFFAHLRQPTSGCRRVYRLSRGNLRSGWYRCVHDMHGPNCLTIHVRQDQVHLSTLPLSATKTSLANLLLHHHPSGATQNISNVPEIQENTKVAQTESGTVAMKI